MCAEMKFKLLVEGNKRLKWKSGAVCKRVLLHFLCTYMVASAHGLRSDLKFSDDCVYVHFVAI